MKGILLFLPFYVIRFPLLSKLNKQAVQRAAHFAPMQDREKPAYWIYQITNGMILIYLCFLDVRLDASWQCWIGAMIYGLGLGLCLMSIIDFARPEEDGFHKEGLYRYSRNPMYVAYFVYYSGCAIWTGSLFLFMVVLVFQISAHWIILAEERWCREVFKERYSEYCNHVRRYF